MLFDLVSQGWTLLLFAGDDAMPETSVLLERIARQVQDAVGDAVRSYLVLDTPANDDAAVTALLDPAREVSRVFAAGKGLVALVRPDGYLGYRGRLTSRASWHRIWRGCSRCTCGKRRMSHRSSAGRST